MLPLAQPLIFALTKYVTTTGEILSGLSAELEGRLTVETGLVLYLVNE